MTEAEAGLHWGEEWGLMGCRCRRLFGGVSEKERGETEPHFRRKGLVQWSWGHECLESSGSVSERKVPEEGRG